MARRPGVLLAFLTLCGMGVLLSAQPVAVPQPTPITLGQPDLPLNGPWKFHVGDNPQWADPNFDDANWQQYVVSSEHPALTLEQALQTDPVPGWQQHGYPGYTGYAWYRIRIGVPQNSGSIALLMPPHVDDAYEVYVNGTKIGNFGELSGWRRVYTSQTELFPIPDALLDKDQPIVLALRFWSLRTEASPSEHNLDGGLRGVPLIGQHALLQIFERSVRQQTWRVPWNLLIDLSLYGSVGLTSLFLFLLSRGQREYLWAGVIWAARRSRSNSACAPFDPRRSSPRGAGGRARYAISSQFTKAVRNIAERFEHRLS